MNCSYAKCAQNSWSIVVSKSAHGNTKSFVIKQVLQNLLFGGSTTGSKISKYGQISPTFSPILMLCPSVVRHKPLTHSYSPSVVQPMRRRMSVMSPSTICGIEHRSTCILNTRKFDHNRLHPLSPLHRRLRTLPFSETSILPWLASRLPQ